MRFVEISLKMALARNSFKILKDCVEGGADKPQKPTALAGLVLLRSSGVQVFGRYHVTLRLGISGQCLLPTTPFRVLEYKSLAKIRITEDY